MPAAPTDVRTRQRSATALRVRWTDASTDETRFELDRRVEPAGGSFGAWAKVRDPGADATSASDAGLTTGDTYQYRVRACNLVICSAYANGPAIVMTPDPTP